MERKSFTFEVKAIDEAEGIFEGYASTFRSTPDSYGEIVDKGAFKKTIQEGKNRIKVLWNHNPDEPIGVPLEMYEDEVGLYVKAKLSLGVQRAREVLALMKDGVVTTMSIGFRTITESVVKDVRHLKEIKLYDTSPVTFAADDGAVILDVKAAGKAINDNNLESVVKAVDSLQALLKKHEGAEPDDSTPQPEGDAGAAELEAALGAINNEMSGFDRAEAERILATAIGD